MSERADEAKRYRVYHLDSSAHSWWASRDGLGHVEIVEPVPGGGFSVVIDSKQLGRRTYFTTHDATIAGWHAATAAAASAIVYLEAQRAVPPKLPALKETRRS